MKIKLKMKDRLYQGATQQVLALAIPMFFVNVLGMGYSIINSIWVGNLLGKNALAALTVSISFIYIIISIASGLTVATSVLTAQHYGNHDNDAVYHTAANSLIMFSAVSILITVLSELFIHSIIRLLGAGENVLPLSASYLRIYLLGYPITVLFYVLNASLSGVGRPKISLLLIFISSAVNAVLDPFLIEKMGLDGAALASVLSQAIALFLGFAYLLHSGILRISGMKSFLSPNPAIMQRLLKTGLPSMGQQLLLPLSQLFIVSLVAKFGTTAVAAMGAGSKIDMLASMPAIAVNSAVSVLTGQLVGAKQQDQIKRIFYSGIAINATVITFVAAAIYIFSSQLIRLFISDSAVISLGVEYLHIISFSYLFFAFSYVTGAITNGAGRTMITFLISFISLCVVRVPLAYYLSRTNLAIDGIWIAVLISQIITALNSMAYYLSGRWKKKNMALHSIAK